MKGFRLQSQPKAIWELWYTSEQAFQHGKSISKICPFCTHSTETCEHVLKCPAKKNDRRQHLLWLEEELRKIGTSTVMTKYILGNTRKWENDEELELIRVPSNIHEQKLNKAISEKRDIGWRFLLWGLLSKKWNTCHEARNKQSSEKQKFYE